jgi:hypothetical protein
VEARGGGEWIVAAGGCARPLHVYRLGPGDWLVSEVGRGNEGRGGDLEQALAALSAEVSPAGWWQSVAGSLNAHHE